MQMEKCPIPHESGSEATPHGATHPHPPIMDSTAVCPVPHGDVAWDGALKETITERARTVAGASGLPEERAAQMAEAVVEARAAKSNMPEVTAAFVKSLEKKLGYGHPLAEKTGSLSFSWTPEALARLENVPAFCRELTKWRVEWTANKLGLGSVITEEIMEVKYNMWGKVSHNIAERSEEGDLLPWTPSARARFKAIPDFVQGQVLEAVEGNARTLGATEIDDALVDQIIQKWATTGDFHEGLYGFK